MKLQVNDFLPKNLNGNNNAFKFFTEMPMVTNRRGLGVKNRENLPNFTLLSSSMLFSVFFITIDSINAFF